MEQESGQGRVRPPRSREPVVKQKKITKRVSSRVNVGSPQLKLLTSVCANSSTSTYLRLPSRLFEGYEGNEKELTVYRYIERYFRQYQSLPNVSNVEEETKIKLPLLDSDGEDSLFYLHDLCSRELIKRELKRPVDQLVNILQHQDITKMKEAEGVIVDMLKTVRSAQRKRNTQTLEETLAAGLDIYESQRNANMRGNALAIKSGIDFIDKACGGGGFIAGVYNFISRQKMGKTFLLMYMAIAGFFQGKTVTFYSMEMVDYLVGIRLIGMLSGVDSDKILQGKLSNWGEAQMLEGIDHILVGERGNEFRFVYGNERGEKDPASVEAHIVEYDPDVIYLDAVYCMQPNNFKGPMGKAWETTPAVLAEIKRIADGYKKPIVCTSQFAKEAGQDGDDGTSETVGFSQRFVQDCNAAFALKKGCNPRESSTRKLELLETRLASGVEKRIFTYINFVLSGSMDFTEFDPVNDEPDFTVQRED